MSGVRRGVRIEGVAWGRVAGRPCVAGECSGGARVAQSISVSPQSRSSARLQVLCAELPARRRAYGPARIARDALPTAAAAATRARALSGLRAGPRAPLPRGHVPHRRGAHRPRALRVRDGLRRSAAGRRHGGLDVRRSGLLHARLQPGRRVRELLRAPRRARGAVRGGGARAGRGAARHGRAVRDRRGRRLLPRGRAPGRVPRRWGRALAAGDRVRAARAGARALRRRVRGRAAPRREPGRGLRRQRARALARARARAAERLAPPAAGRAPGADRAQLRQLALVPPAGARAPFDPARLARPGAAGAAQDRRARRQRAALPPAGVRPAGTRAARARRPASCSCAARAPCRCRRSSSRSRGPICARAACAASSARWTSACARAACRPRASGCWRASPTTERVRAGPRGAASAGAVRPCSPASACAA